MKTIYKVSLMAILGLCLCLHGMAQDTTARKKDTTVLKKYQPFDVNLQVRSLYIWRGFIVSNSPISDVDIHYTTRDRSFAVGVWGGTGFTGDYKEFDYYVSYTKSGFNFSVWDINNFTNYPNANLFNYNPASTSHFIDVTAGYQFGNSFPLSINWSTIVQGRDTYVKSNGDLANAYSNYVVLDYRLWKQDSSDLHIFAGGGFAFGRDQNFYGSKPNIVNTGLTLNKELVLFNYHMPVAATAMFSPEHKDGALQLIINVF
ncbi:hypothetical protein JN11_04416 [Mucilaginibacter frigoritolerans]|uniref:Outer membrane beta-barrel porin/alpha-amylase n=1 Tax=Mucilaginibacter frigoritolerans TaxID=652788 RepID=A0A562TP04_9SPHI|nr:hypothetical protein [Mucilaginibacter frigoritolerans]TWI95301.1 hypothetical protein JN11_04416 [Mucilaginibacter frigoritolerans]